VRNPPIALLLMLYIVSNAKAGDISIGDCIVREANALTTEEIIALTQPIIDEGSLPTHCVQAAAALETAIRKTGAFATRVFIDALEDSPNIILRVVEGRLAENGVKLGRSGARVNDDVILGQTNEILKPGTTITAEKFERAILLLNDLPGIAGSESTLLPAEKEGEANFEIYPEDGKLIEGHVYTDNFGSAFTGEYRVGAAVDIKSPFLMGEKFSVGANVSDLGTYYISFDASMPITNSGLRCGVSIGVLDYHTDETNDLRGYSREGSVYLHYPLIRSRQTNLNGEVRFGRENMKDEDNSSTVTDRHVDTGHLVVSGDRIDGLLGGGTSKFSLEGVVGYLDLGGYEPFRQEDQNTARTNGRFSRMAWSVSRLQHINGPWQTYIELAGQLASKRLDSSQSISFGEPYDFPG
jgi:hemolysin activation/secretion protein